MRVDRSSRNARDSIGSASAPFNEGREFDSLYREFNEMLHFIVRGITLTTETAADLEEANEKEEVDLQHTIDFFILQLSNFYRAFFYTGCKP